MRANLRNGIAVALAASLSLAGMHTPAAADSGAAFAELAPIRTNTAVLEDSDHDGIPDIWEEQGVVLSDGTEIPLPDWGADPHRPDLYLQLNWMKSEYDSLGCNARAAAACADANRKSYAPSVETLEQLVKLFDDHGINLHIDAGDVYTNIPNYGKRFGGETVDYAPVYFGPGEPEARKLLGNIDAIGERQNIFRVGIIGDQMRQDSMASGIALVGDNSFYVSNNARMTTQEQLRNSILHEFGHTLGLRHYGAADYTTDIKNTAPMQAGYKSVMNYKYQFSHFDYSDQPYFADTPEGKRFVPADWDVLRLDNSRIGAYAESIGARAHIEVAEVKADDIAPVKEIPAEEIAVADVPAAEKVAVEAPVEEIKAAKADKAEKAPESFGGEHIDKDTKVDQQAPVKKQAEEQPAKAEAKAEKAEQAQHKVEQVQEKVAKDAPAAKVNVAAIVGSIVALLAILGAGFAFMSMQ